MNDHLSNVDLNSDSCRWIFYLFKICVKTIRSLVIKLQVWAYISNLSTPRKEALLIRSLQPRPET